jgi:hypothetical protein
MEVLRRMSRIKVINANAEHSEHSLPSVSELVEDFARRCEPLEADNLYVLTDSRTNAQYCECHILGSTIGRLSTIDVPLDPDEQPEYRANREIAEDHAAYEKMKSDARAGRAFSNIVAEFIDSGEPDQPLQIIGGQHRFNAIREALDRGVDEYHGVKVYFGLDSDQRLDVQLISNTNIAVSNDLLDRMYETVKGPQLRDWCQEVGLLDEGQDFADKRQRGQPITVRAARTFIYNYYTGRGIDPKKFSDVRTTPVLLKTGDVIPEWEQLKEEHPEIWDDPKLKKAGEEFAALGTVQREYFSNEQKGDSNVDFAEKASNYAVLSAWAYIAGMLRANEVRLKKHYALRKQKRDPLNAAALAKGRHKSDPENYRGLGYRTDPKERGRFVELFYLQAEKGEGITRNLIDVAIKRYHAKQAVLEAREAEEKV